MNNSSFPWKLLRCVHDKNGGRAFEDIAYQYVEDHFKQYKWQKTSITRDGNRDAYAVISVFSTHFKEAEIWMEAKFSITHKNMSRYTIDKTIVSALCVGRVSKVFFVTNMLVPLRVRKQVLLALEHDGFGHQDISFCTKYDLEIWLTNTEKGKELFGHYFKGIHPDLFSVKGLKMLGEPSFYDIEINYNIFPEPLSSLKTNHSYIAEINVYSHHATHITISDVKGSGLKLKEPHHFDIKKGVNEIRLSIACQTNANPKLKLQSDDCKDSILVEFSIPILDAEQYKITIASQSATQEKILELFQNYELRDNGSMIYEITGPAGMGKSYLLSKLAGNKLMHHHHIIFYTFSSVNITNNHILAELYLRLFYYSIGVKQDDIVIEHLQIPKDLKEMLTMLYKGNDTKLDEWMLGACSKQLIPQDFKNDRVIVLDNTERLSNSQNIFLKYLIQRIYASRSHSFILLSGRRKMYSGYSYRLYLRKEDLSKNLLQVLNLRNSVPRIFLRAIRDVSSLSLIIDRLFCDKGYIPLSSNSNHEILKFILKDKIEKVVLNSDEGVKDMLQLIYTLTNGLPYQLVYDNNSLILPLIEEDLVRYGTDSYLPVNSLTCSLFRENYTEYNLKSDVLKQYLANCNEDEQMRFNLGSSNYYQYFERALERTNDLISKQDYRSVAYILEPLFLPSIKLDVLTEDPISIRLRWNYIYAKSNVDTYFNIKKEHEYFVQDIDMVTQEESLECLIKSLAEIVCFSFEDADIISVYEYAEKVRIVRRKLNLRNKKANEAMLLCKSIILLSLCSEDKYDQAEVCLREIESSYASFDEIPVIKMRYARCFFHCDIDKAMNILQEVLPVLKESHNYKWANACQLDIQFLTYLKDTNAYALFKGIKTIRESIPQYVSLYRCNLRLFAACALVNAKETFGSEEETEFFSYWDEYEDERGSRFQKEKGYDYMILAAVDYLHGKLQEMSDKLETAKSFFLQLGESYKIPIEHNLTISKQGQLADRRVLFYNKKSNMNPMYFYIDPRMW